MSARPPQYAEVTQPIRLEPEMPSQATVPSRTIQQTPQPPYPYTQPRPAAPRPKLATRPQSEKRNQWWLITPVIAVAVLLFSTCGALTLGAGLIYSRGVLPQVSVAGVPLGGQSQAAAAATLQSELHSLTLRDGSRTWSLDPTELGITPDAQASAERAYTAGRTAGDPFSAIFGGMDLAPVLSVDIAAASAAFEDLAPQFEIAPVNAGIRLVNGEIETTPPQEGRQLNMDSLIQRLQSGAAAEIVDGVLDLPMYRVEPRVTDASPMVALARDLLAKPLQITLFDPIDNATANWSLPAEAWSQWLTATQDPDNPDGLALALDDSALRGFFDEQSSALESYQYFDLDEAVDTLQQALNDRSLRANVRIFQHDRPHTVQPGETVISIAWDYGVPYPWIQAVNPGLGDSLTVGQTISIPSADNFFDFPVVPNKRVEVSISQQRVRVFENGQMIYDWLASTGINSSPTWPGVYQIISHEPNAYAGNWNLWMPNFLGVYRPIPGADFTNGFHGFPTRGGSQLLWTNDLGRRVTYGCILISSENAQTLYNWAENGVVVEILP